MAIKIVDRYLPVKYKLTNGCTGMNSNKRRIKKLGVAIMIGLLSLSVTSCGVSRYVDTIKNSIREYQKKKRENDIQGIVMQAIMDKNVEPIYQKLCPQLKKRPEIRKQISEMINTFDSDMVVICLYSVNKDEPDKKGLIAIQIFTEAESSSKQKELYTIAGDI